MIKKTKGLLIATTLTLVIGFNGITATAASLYKDVPENYWAYSSVSSMAAKGILIGDSAGNYTPEKIINKFDISKALSRAAGYKETGLTTAEKTYYDQVYTKNQATLNQFKKFKMWDSTVDKKIAFLLDKGILTLDDLNKFIYLDKAQDGTSVERLTGASLQEMAVFITKLMGKNAEATALKVADLPKFADDSLISPANKVYVYYMAKVGVITADVNNNVKPKLAMTKAMTAVVIDKALQAMAPTTTVTTPVVQPVTTPTVQTYDSFSGRIDDIIAVYSALQIAPATGNKRIYSVGKTATIYVDGINKSFSDLKKNMLVICTIVNGEIIEVRGQSSFVTTEPVISTDTPIVADNSGDQISEADQTLIEGIVSAKNNLGTSSTVTIEMKIISPKNAIITQTKELTLAQYCTISKGGTFINFDDIQIGDVVSGAFIGSKIYSINLENKNLSITGTLVSKSYSTSNEPVLSVATADGRSYSLIVTDATSVNRKNSGSVRWFELRIGDKVTIDAEYNKIIKVSAEGTSAIKDGILQEIHISKENTSIVLALSESNYQTYVLMPGIFDVYTLRVGSRISVVLDSLEVAGITILQQASQANMNATVSSVKSDFMIIMDASQRSTVMYFDKNTVVTDAATGARTTVNALTANMQIFVNYESSPPNPMARTITILRR